MNVLGLDTGPTRTGWCCGDGKTVPDCGVFTFNCEIGARGMLGAKFWQALNVVMARFKPVLVIYERPIVTPHDRLPFLRARYGVDFMVETYCATSGVKCEDRPLQSLKKELTGSPSAAKGAMVAVARKCGLDLPDGESAKDASDAFAAWLLGLRVQSPALSRDWDRRIWSPRGAML